MPNLTGIFKPGSGRDSISEQQELQQLSVLDFDEGPEVAGAATVQPQTAQPDLQIPTSEEGAHQQLPADFGDADEDSMAFEGLLEAASGNPSNDSLHSWEPEDAHAESAAARHDGELPSFFQPDEGTGYIEALALESEVSGGDGERADDVLEQKPTENVEDCEESSKQSATLGSDDASLQKEPQPVPGSTVASYSYGATAAAAGQEAASQASTHSIIFRPLTPAAAQEHRHPQASSQPTQPEQSSEDQSAIDSVQEAVMSMGRAARLRTQLHALSAALEQAERCQQAKRRAISRYEWMHEAILGPAGVLGPPVQLPQLVHTSLQPKPSP